MEAQAVTQVEYKRLHRSMNYFYRILFDFLVESGLRIGDALKLKTEEIFFTTDPVVKFQKTGESRQIHISRPLWVQMIALSGDIYVFESPQNEESISVGRLYIDTSKGVYKAFQCMKKTCPFIACAKLLQFSSSWRHVQLSRFSLLWGTKSLKLP